MTFIRRLKEFLLRWWGWQVPEQPAGWERGAILEFDAESSASLQDIANAQQRSAEEVLADLLTSEIARWASTKELNQEILRRWNTLSAREQQVAALACRGLTNRQIAAYLHISPETVKVHMRQGLGKLGYRTKRDLQASLAHWNFSE
jgi:DNA-binding NarL/FixJ family response regulator